MIIFLALVFPSTLYAQTFKNLLQARQAVAGAKTQDALRSIIFAAIPQLSIRDGITLCREVEPKSGAALKAELRGTLGSLYLLLGQTADAASWYAKAAALDAKYNIVAARLAVAIGDAHTIATIVKAGGISKETQALLEVWGLLLDGKYTSASARVKETLASFPNTQVSSELLFLQYIADFGQYGAAKPSITSEYPSSMGSDLIAGKVIPAPPFLLSLGFSWMNGAAPLKDNVLPANESKALGSSGQWLQVGYFSLRENAQRLSAILASKHFESRVVEIKNKDGEPRWLVQVAAAENWQKTQAALKDLGYESYLASP